jgi:hypothetical protein
MRYAKILAWTAIVVSVLSAAQFSSIHMLTGRPSSWLFEASLDFGPPLLFAGDMAQLTLNKGSQAPLRDQPVPLAAGVLTNVLLYGTIAIVVAWLFFPPASPALSGEKRRR